MNYSEPVNVKNRHKSDEVVPTGHFVRQGTLIVKPNLEVQQHRL